MPVPWTRFVGTVRMMNSFSRALWELVHVLVHLGPGHLGLGTEREGSWFSEGLFLRLSRLEALVALVEGRNLCATHCLVLVKLPQARDHRHQLVHASLLTFGRCPIADQMVEAQRKSLNERNIFFLNVFPGNLVLQYSNSKVIIVVPSISTGNH